MPIFQKAEEVIINAIKNDDNPSMLLRIEGLKYDTAKVLNAVLAYSDDITREKLAPYIYWRDLYAFCDLVVDKIDSIEIQQASEASSQEVTTLIKLGETCDRDHFLDRLLFIVLCSNPSNHLPLIKTCVENALKFDHSIYELKKFSPLLAAKILSDVNNFDDIELVFQNYDESPDSLFITYGDKLNYAKLFPDSYGPSSINQLLIRASIVGNGEKIKDEPAFNRFTLGDDHSIIQKVSDKLGIEYYLGKIDITKSDIYRHIKAVN